MGLTMRERHASTRELTERYRKARKKEGGQILDEFTVLTGYTRSYARFMLRNCGERVLKMLGAKRHRVGGYSSAAFLEGLTRFWALSDSLCGKRLAAFLREVLPHLERTGELASLVPPALHGQLLVVSPATLGRLLAPTKQEARLKGRSYTHAGP